MHHLKIKCRQVLKLVCLLVFVNTASAQAPRPVPVSYGSPAGNYVRTWDVVAPNSDPNSLTVATDPCFAKITTQYLDGLGRPLQTVVKKGSKASGNAAVDVVSAVEYDALGRIGFQYLPFASTASNGLFKTNPFQQQESFMQTQFGGQGETFFYGQTQYENSPLNRLEKTLAPGNSWVGAERALISKYWVNTLDDAVRIWNVQDNGTGSFGSYASSSVYATGELYKNVTEDENGKQVIQFKDKEGKIILKKVQLLDGAYDDGTIGKGHAGWLCTYYIYDFLGQLRCVVQPEGVKELDKTTVNWSFSNLPVLLEELCFRYEYDHKGRMIVKQVPGAKPVYMVYDVRDRLVLAQDGTMRLQNKWLFTKYDQLNRQTVTGLYANTSHTGQAAMQAYLNAQNLALWENYNPGTFPLYTLNQSFPQITGGIGDVLTFTYYDDYSYSQQQGLQFEGYDKSFESYFETPSNTTFPYPQLIESAGKAIGQVTGQWQALSTGPTLVGNYYDKFGRLIQTKYYNQTAGPTAFQSGLDITTHQYAFSGQLLQTVSRHEKAGVNPQSYLLQTRNSYDELGRLIKVEKKASGTEGGNPLVANMGNWKVTSELEYDALGQLKTKKIGTKLLVNDPLARMEYDYNIRGWMLGANRDYAKATNNTDHYFGFDLGYDKMPIKLSNGTEVSGYQKAAFNGNITGTVWKSKGDNVLRKYDFSYDNTNRFTKADYLQYSNGTWNKTDLDFTVQGSQSSNNYQMQYDANGNIMNMVQHGFKPSSPTGVIDHLAYNYYDYSNRLKNVIDGAQDKQTTLGDFRYSSLYEATISTNKPANTIDYLYDDNGNLVKDRNKDIEKNDNTNGIEYNHLNLPVKIWVKKASGLKGWIAYTYDTGGNKLKKVVKEEGISVTHNNTAYTTDITTTTTYIGPFVYERKEYSTSDLLSLGYEDRLQHIAHEEGRIRKAQIIHPCTSSPGQPPCLPVIGDELVFDFMLKDHLGNVRMVLTEEEKTDTYPKASFEDATLQNEQTYYERVNVSREVHDIYGNNNNNQVQSLRKNTQSVGVGKFLKVMAGDKIHLKVDYFIPQVSTDNSGSNGIGSAITSLLSMLNGGTVPIHGSEAAAITTSLNLPGSAFSDFFQPQSSGVSNPMPKAYLNILFFDEQFRFVQAGSEALQVTTMGSLASLTRVGGAAKEAIKSGYVYIYLSNESNNVVYFDDFQIIAHERSAILEETHYYPFGLTMTGISSKTVGGVENKKKYNDIELENDLEIQAYDAFFRELDPQIARWWQIDPVTDGYEDLSPYVSMYDNPLTFSDPLGNEGEVCCLGLKKLAAGVGGAILGTIDNNIPGSNLTGAIAKSGIISDPDVAEAWNGGVTASNVMGMIQGSGEATGGTGILTTSIAVTAGTGGLSIEVTGPTAAIGTGMVVHGTFVYAKSQQNLATGNGLIQQTRSESDKKLVQEAEAKKVKEQKVQERQQNRQQASQQGSQRQGSSNQSTRGSHDSSKKGRGNAKKNDHQEADARRAREQKAADERKKKR